MKYKGIPLVEKPWYLDMLPTHKWISAQANYSKIWVKKDILNNLISNNSSPFWISLMEHEVKHIERQHEIGKWKFWLYYKLFPKFRINEELIADKARIEYVKKHNVPYSIEDRARMLSSWKYFWGISYENAKRKLEKIYNEA